MQEIHAEWVAEQLAAGLDGPTPDDRPEDSDYNLHVPDMEAAGDAIDVLWTAIADTEMQRADLNPTGDDDVFKRYWVYEEGRARWNTWTELVAHLVKHVSPNKAKRIASDWFHERYGFWPGDDRNRVRQGKPPRGDHIGPG
jgi:hypothetical protein